jgi:4-oxalocrotonate tautomerase
LIDEETHMPYVNVRITRDGVTREQKAQVIAEITETLQRVLGKSPELTHIAIDEVSSQRPQQTAGLARRPSAWSGAIQR